MTSRRGAEDAPGHERGGKRHPVFFAVVVALNLVYKNKLLFLYPAALILAFTRVYVGAHFPSDVVGGAIIGGFGSYLTLRILRNYLRPELPA